MGIDIVESGLGLLTGKFHQILMELSAQDIPIFLFLDDNLSKCQGILTKLGTCVDISKGDLVWNFEWADFISF